MLGASAIWSALLSRRSNAAKRTITRKHKQSRTNKRKGRRSSERRKGDMNWHELALTSVRETRFCAYRLYDNLADVKQSLHNLQGEYDTETALVVIAFGETNRTIRVLSELESKLSSSKGNVT